MQLVDLTSVIPDLVIDLRYASENNITGRILYVNPEDTVPRLEKVAAEALEQAATALRQNGLRIVVWDAYRPAVVQVELRAINDDEKYVLEESNHCLGLAIDLTLVTQDGQYLDMGTDHDDFSEKAHANSHDLSPEQLSNRSLLQVAMADAGFKQWPYEWWHFDYLGNLPRENGIL